MILFVKADIFAVFSASMSFFILYFLFLSLFVDNLYFMICRNRLLQITYICSIKSPGADPHSDAGGGSAECDDPASRIIKPGIKQKVRGTKPRTATYIALAATQSQYMNRQESERASNIAKCYARLFMHIILITSQVNNIIFFDTCQ